MPQKKQRRVKKVNRNYSQESESGSLEEIQGAHQKREHGDKVYKNKMDANEFASYDRQKAVNRKNAKSKFDFENPKSYGAKDKWSRKASNSQIREFENEDAYEDIMELKGKREASYALKGDETLRNQVSNLFAELNQICNSTLPFESFMNGYSNILATRGEKKDRIKAFYNNTLNMFVENLEEVNLDNGLQIIEKFDTMMLKVDQLFESKSKGHTFPSYKYGGNSLEEFKTMLSEFYINAPTPYEANVAKIEEKHTYDRIAVLNEKSEMINESSEKQLLDILCYVKTAREVHDNKGFFWKLFNPLKNRREERALKNIESQLSERFTPDRQEQIFEESKSGVTQRQEDAATLDEFIESKKSYFANTLLDVSIPKQVMKEENVFREQIVVHEEEVIEEEVIEEIEESYEEKVFENQII